MVTRKEELAFDISKFNNDDQSEIERIKTFLEAAEVIKIVARQSKIMPGGKLITPKTIFATDKRIIIRDPNMLGLRGDINSIPYSQINNVKVEKGAFTSKIMIESGQFKADDEGFIDAIPKKKAAEIIGIINANLRSAQHYHIPDPPVQADDNDPLTLLKKRLVKGEITKEEFEDLKKMIE